jgi:antitoxin FitA
MPNLSVRKLDAQVYQQLRLRAAKHGISMEEEVRQIIYQAVAASERISDVFKKYFGRNNGVDLAELTPREPHFPLDFNE